ncbi:hypothetical protein [Mycolicibacterium septicum]|uniref:hypothetical protein n=1 Tax=Mycolicibacterium septicum TaxID=98668 RepID=UPI001AF7A00A|nr:hypothetical protein [Mycolicibacterium septicum]QRY53116.1 hypothetical protein JVX95_07185 [Mycolicibacterium septicum]
MSSVPVDMDLNLLRVFDAVMDTGSVSQALDYAGTAIRAGARTDLAHQAGGGSLAVHIADAYPLTVAAQERQTGLAGHASAKLVLILSHPERRNQAS